MTVNAFILFGATGDLSRRKLLPALYQLFLRGMLPREVVAVALDDWSEDGMRRFAIDAVRNAGGLVDTVRLDAFAERIHYVGGDYSDPSTFKALAERAHGRGPLIHHLAVPPALVATVIDQLAGIGLLDDARVLAEKPFGRDLASAREQNRVLLGVLPERSIYRIDHYLAKESIENLMVFRFGNELFEPVWNRGHVASVQVTMAETIGVEGRGAFYDAVGAVRDVVQNHLLHIVALLAMEPPVGQGADAWRAEISRVLQAISPADPRSVVRGQYEGYRDEPGVGVGSDTETYAAMRLEIDSWRWAGVPFFIRAGKALGNQSLEAVVEFREPPQQFFSGDGSPSSPNIMRFCLGAGAGVDLRLRAKSLGPTLAAHDVDLRVDFKRSLGTPQEPYERLLEDAVLGDVHRFACQEAVEQQWRIVQPVLDAPVPVVGYKRGSGGPVAAEHVPGPAGWYAAAS
jgi:glucose-6-phosphate 1-dehydrogenase